jgi:tetratricopeptide (TPR) repeat protein
MKKFCAAVGLSTVLATGLGGCAATNGVIASTAPADSYTGGKENFAAGQFGLALVNFQKALEEQGPSVDRLNALGATYDQLSRFDLADRAYRQALVLDPESAQTLNNIGYSYLLRGRADLASAYLAKAQSLAKGDSRIGANLALAAKVLDQPPAVIAVSATVAGSDQPKPVPAAPETPNLAVTPVPTPEASVVSVLHPQQDTYIEPVAHGVYRLVTGNEHIEAAHVATARSSGMITIPQVREPMPAVAAVPVSAVQSEPLATVRGVTPVAEPVHFSTPAAPVAGIIQVAATSSDASFIPDPVLPEKHVARAAPSVQLPVASAPTAGVIEVATIAPAATTATQTPASADIASNIDASRAQFSVALIEVSNGSGIERSGARFRAYLRSRGIPVRRLTNDAKFGRADTILFYREGFLEEAQAIAAELGMAVALKQNDQQRSDLRLRLGLDSKPFDNYLAAGIVTGSR